MASTHLMLASKEPITITTTRDHNQENRAEKSRGKKTAKSRSPAKKKQPQRGMGVEQLERLRVQEGWKKLIERDPVHNLNHRKQQQISQPFAPPSFGSPLICNGGNGSGLNRGFIGFSGGGGGTSSGNGGSGFDRCWDPRFGNIGKNNVLVESNLKELSSIPNMQCGFDFDPCGLVHFKKKRTHNDNPAFLEASPMMNRCKFNGLDLGANANFIGDQNTINFNNATRVVPIKGVEIKAVHVNENLEGGSNILMEYDFLPSDNKSSFYCPNEDHIDFASNNDKTIDLSLKL